MRVAIPILLALTMAACLPPKSAPAPQAAPAQAAAIPSPAPAAAPSPKPAQAAAPAAEAAETPLAAQPEPAPLPASLPVYSPDPALPDQGVLTSIGSDSMEPLMLLWFDDYHAIHQRFSSNFICKGSATAPRALIAGNAIMGQMSRQMTQEEWDGFQAKYGYPPTRIVVAMDALAVYVNANNPIPRLGLEQVDAIFGRDRKGGCGKSLDVWGDLGLDQEWTHRAIRAYGRDENSGTRAFFRERVLKNGEYKPTVQAVQDQFALVEAAAMDASAIVYGPIQHKVRMVRAVPIADYGADHAILPTVQNVVNGSYPLARFLYIYLNLPPGKPCDPLVKDFLRFILSRQGQTDVALFGAVPLPADLAALNLDKVK